MGSGSGFGVTTRRDWMLAAAGTGLGALGWSAAGGRSPTALGLAAEAGAGFGRVRDGGELSADLLIVGGGLGGVAAALAGLRRGHRVILTEETDWIGGQLTSQAVPPDEHPWIETHGCTRAYREFREGVRDYYRKHYPLTAAARRTRNLNPGLGSVSRICHEPRVALAVLEGALAPYLSGGRLALLTGTRPVGAETAGDRIEAVRLRRRDGSTVTARGRIVLDATETGELLELGGVEHVTGAESRGRTGEPNAPEVGDPLDMQAVTVCFAMEHQPGGDFAGDPPPDYDFWREYVPEMTPPWPGKLLSMEVTHPVTLAVRPVFFDPESGPGEGLNLWIYRRIAGKGNFEEGAYLGEITLVNWPQNDYWLGNVFGGTEEENAGHLRGARNLSLALAHWLQTEVPRRDGGKGYPGLRLRPELMGTADGLAMAAYIRESRRIEAEFTVTENHVGTEARRAETGLGASEVQATRFEDSVGVGAYRIDLHPTTGKKNYLDISSLPYQIPLGALIPKRVENLLPACKNLGVTHITNGCYRLHPTEWNIGESAALAASFALGRRIPVRGIRSNAAVLSSFQNLLRAEGVEMEWPRTRPL